MSSHACIQLYTYWGFPTSMVYLYCISCVRYTILVGNPRYSCRYSYSWMCVGQHRLKSHCCNFSCKLCLSFEQSTFDYRAENWNYMSHTNMMITVCCPGLGQFFFWEFSIRSNLQGCNLSDVCWNLDTMYIPLRQFWREDFCLWIFWHA